MTTPRSTARAYRGRFSNHPTILEYTARIKRLQKLRRLAYEKLKRPREPQPKELTKQRQAEAARRSWRQRREKYGPTGMKP